MKNTLALITGASSGLGLEFANIHAKNGGDVILVARRIEKLKELKEKLEYEYKIKAYIFEKDLSKPGSGTSLYNEIKDSGLDVEYLINNAGFGGIGEFHKRELKKDLEMIDLNIVTLTELSGLFLKDFINKDSGKILNVSSTASLIPGPLQSVYYATKAYVTSFSNALHQETKSTKVSVTALLPGATKTEFGKISGMDKTSLFDTTADAHQVALDGYNGMLSNKLNIISGITFSQKILFKIIPFLPKSLVLKMVYNMQKEK